MNFIERLIGCFRSQSREMNDSGSDSKSVSSRTSPIFSQNEDGYSIPSGLRETPICNHPYIIRRIASSSSFMIPEYPTDLSHTASLTSIVYNGDISSRRSFRRSSTPSLTYIRRTRL